MSAATNYLEDEILDHVLNGLSWASPANVYIGLSTTTPNEDGTNFTEPGAGAYARVLPTGSPRFTLQNNDPREAANTDKVEFPEATGSWGTVTHFGIFDAISGGNLLIFAALSASVSVVATETVRFSAGALVVTLD